MDASAGRKSLRDIFQNIKYCPFEMPSSLEECKVYSQDTGAQPPESARVGIVLANQNCTLCFYSTNKMD